MLAATTFVFGPWVHAAQALAFACTAATACFTWQIARRLLGTEVAALALLLWGLQSTFSVHAGLFNHNTVAMTGVSATAYCFLRALERGALGWWIVTGAAAGLALLAKYQALIGLTGVLVAAAFGGNLVPKAQRRGCLVAVIVALLMLVPHIAWLTQRQAMPLDYALQTGRSLDAWERLRNVVGFSAQQVRLLLPALLFAGALLLVQARLGAIAAWPNTVDERRRRAWLFGLIAFPLGLTLLSSPLLGLALQNHWGYQALQFASLWLAWRIHRRVPRAGALWLAGAVAAHAAFLVITLTMTGALRPSPEHTPSRRLDRAWPAQELADAVLHDWRQVTSCPLAYVVGPSFEAGMVSVYAGGRAAVLEDGSMAKSPWIDAGDLRRRGAVHVGLDPRALPGGGAAGVGSLDLRAVSPPPHQRVYWTIVAPVDCTTTKPTAQ